LYNNRKDRVHVEETQLVNELYPGSANRSVQILQRIAVNIPFLSLSLMNGCLNL
jgi:hypothetical protein